MTRDVFLCHASEDKDEIVRPLVEACNQADISCWYDEAEIHWGDSITHKVSEGLSMSQYVIVVLSPSFVAKNWPERELLAILNQEASSGAVKILPLVVGRKQEQQEILERYPLLNDKQYLPWDGNLRRIVEVLQRRLGRTGFEAATGDGPPSKGLGLHIPLPKLKKQFSQRDKDLFLRNAFTVVRRYFQNGLEELDRQYQEVETDFQDVHNLKFVATIYVRGEVGKRCKVWIGGYGRSDAILFHEGQFTNDSDNAWNDMLSVADNAEQLGFEPSDMWHGRSRGKREGLLSEEQAAEHLWTRFTESLG